MAETSTVERCVWCAKRPARSDWEQMQLSTQTYKRLCKRCATKRLNNPYNALYDMRKVAPLPPDQGTT